MRGTHLVCKDIVRGQDHIIISKNVLEFGIFFVDLRQVLDSRINKEL